MSNILGHFQDEILGIWSPHTFMTLFAKTATNGICENRKLHRFGSPKVLSPFFGKTEKSLKIKKKRRKKVRSHAGDMSCSPLSSISEKLANQFIAKTARRQDFRM
jgi:hypothetical protein